MALFGGDIVTVTTPDGRQVQMPAGLAASFPALKPLPPPQAAAPPIPSAPQPSFGPADRAALGALTPPAPPPPPATDIPVTAPAQAPAGAGPGGPRGPVTNPAAATDAGPPNAPGQRPLSNDELAKVGNAGAYNASTAGLAEERTAAKQQGEALANQATAVGHAMEAANAEADRLLEQRRQAAEANAKALQDKTDEYLQNSKKIADTKINRESDHPALAALGVVLGVMGSAMRKDPNNPALQAYFGALDRKADKQLKDLERRRADLGVQRDALGMQRQQGQDRLAELDTHRLAAIEQGKRQIDEIKQKTTSDVVRANADAAMAALTQRGAEILGTAVGREQQKREAEAARAQAAQQHRESLGVTVRGQNLQNDQFYAGINERRQERLDEIAKDIALSGTKGAAEKAKSVSELGIVDPTTSNLMLTPEGQKKLAQADSYEAAARKASPEQAAKLNEQAKLLRQSAQQNDVALALNKKGAEDAQKIINTTQNVVNNIDAAKRMIGAGPEAWNREEWASIKIALQNVKINYAQTIGERLSVRALEALDDVLSIDTDKISSRSVDKGKALAALKTLDTELSQGADVALKGAGVNSGWTPGHPKDAVSFEGKTAAELGEDAKPGVLKQYLVDPIIHPIATAQGERTPEARTAAATEAALGRTNARGQASNYGLAPDVDDRTRGLIQRAGRAGEAEYGRIVENLAAPLTKISGKDARPSLAIGMAKLLGDEDPKLLEAVLAKVPPLQAKEIRAATVPVPGGPRVPSSLGKLSPDALVKYNAYLKSQGLPEVAQ